MSVGSTNFPSSLDSHTSASPLGFGEVNNQAYTLSTAAHTSSVTTITVASTSAFPTKGYLVVKRELISYTGKTSTTFTGCTRGVGGTTAAAFLSGTLVEQVPVAANHNDLAAGIVAVETKVGITSSTPTANKVLGADGTGTSSWRQVATGDIADGAITSAKILDGTIATGDLAANAISTRYQALQVPTAGAFDVVSTFTPTDVPGASLSWTTTTGSLILFIIQAQAHHSVNNGRIYFEITDGSGTALGQGTGTPFIGNPTANVDQAHYLVAVYSVSSGAASTFKVRMTNVDTGTATLLQYGMTFTALEFKR